MIDLICQDNKCVLYGCRTLLSILLISFGSVCSSDELTTKTETATGNYIPGEIGEPDDGILKEKPNLEDLGEGRYRIGAIMVDKVKRLVTVPGVMLPYEDGKAIEFIATTKHGYKSYESVLMLEANAFEFNLACILIGLDAKRAVLPRYHFDPEPIKGDSVSISVGWENAGRHVEYDVVELLKAGEKKPIKPSNWSYTGSMFIEGNRYLAQMDGVLVGIIHDPASIIEHREGLGVGNWGGITIDPNIAPSNGQKVIVKVQSTD